MPKDYNFVMPRMDSKKTDFKRGVSTIKGFEGSMMNTYMINGVLHYEDPDTNTVYIGTTLKAGDFAYKDIKTGKKFRVEKDLSENEGEIALNKRDEKMNGSFSITIENAKDLKEMITANKVEGSVVYIVAKANSFNIYMSFVPSSTTKTQNNNKFYSMISINTDIIPYKFDQLTENNDNITDADLDKQFIVSFNTSEFYDKINTVVKDSTIYISKENKKKTIVISTTKKGEQATRGIINVDIQSHLPADLEENVKIWEDSKKYFKFGTTSYTNAFKNINKQKSGGIYIHFFDTDKCALIQSKKDNGSVDQSSAVYCNDSENSIESLEKLCITVAKESNQLIEYAITPVVSKNICKVAGIARNNICFSIRDMGFQYTLSHGCFVYVSTVFRN